MEIDKLDLEEIFNEYKNREDFYYDFTGERTKVIYKKADLKSILTLSQKELFEKFENEQTKYEQLIAYDAIRFVLDKINETAGE